MKPYKCEIVFSKDRLNEMDETFVWCHRNISVCGESWTVWYMGGPGRSKYKTVYAFDKEEDLTLFKLRFL